MDYIKANSSNFDINSSYYIDFDIVDHYCIHCTLDYNLVIGYNYRDYHFDCNSFINFCQFIYLFFN